MAFTVLWCDNDPGMIKPFADALMRAGYTVEVVRSVGMASQRLRDADFDLLILDVMIPTLTQEEEEMFPPETTNFGGHTGLAFYAGHRDFLKEHGVEVLVLTVRLDKAIKERFVEAGLPPGRFVSKIAVRDSALFVETVSSILEKRIPPPPDVR